MTMTTTTMIIQKRRGLRGGDGGGGGRGGGVGVNCTKHLPESSPLLEFKNIAYSMGVICQRGSLGIA